MTYSGDKFNPQDHTQVTGGAAANPLTADFAPGQIIGGQYQVLAWIGAGGMGNVYRVRHTMMQTEYALKTLSADKVTEIAWRRFQNEAQAIAKMNHPNIVAIYNLALHDNHLPFYAMDLLNGQTLQDLLRGGGPMEVKEFFKIFRQVCSGLSYAHKKGIIHRDIKPPNIFIVDSPVVSGSGQVKLLDFGIAKLTGDDNETLQKLTGAGEICGSPYYMSPEQIEGGKVDARSDVYSLGCTMFEALTGTPPFRGRNAMDTMFMHQEAKIPSLASAAGNKSFPPELERLIATMLAKQPMDRYQSVEAVNEEIQTISGEKKEADRPPKKSKSSQSRSRETQAQTQGTRRPAVSRSQLVEAAPEPAKVNMRPYLAAAAALFVLAGGIVTFFCLHKPGSSGTQTAAAGGTASGSATDQASLMDTRVPFGQEVTGKKGKTEIVFHFPNQAIGELLVDNSEPSKEVKGIPCQGTFSIEGDHKLYFLALPSTIFNPDLFLKLQGGYLTSISFPALDLAAKEQVTEAIKRIYKIKGLERLDLIKCSAASDDILPYLDKMPDLRNLSLQGTNISIVKLTGSRALGRLTSLTYTKGESMLSQRLGNHLVRELGNSARDIEGVMHERQRHHHHHDGDFDDHDMRWDMKDARELTLTPLLEHLARSNNLTSLDLPDVGLSQEDLKLIGKMTNLQELDLNNTNLTSRDIESLTGLKNMAVFQANNCMIDQFALPSFKKLASQGKLAYLLIHSPTMTPETVAQFQKELPTVALGH